MLNGLRIIIKKRWLKKYNIEVIIYEPTINQPEFNNCAIVNNLRLFSSLSDIIIANRFDKELEQVRKKVYPRDLFSRD